MADFFCKYSLHHRAARGLCNRTERDAPTPIANFQLGELPHHRLLRWIEPDGISGGLLFDALVFDHQVK